MSRRLETFCVLRVSYVCGVRKRNFWQGLTSVPDEIFVERTTKVSSFVDGLSAMLSEILARYFRLVPTPASWAAVAQADGPVLVVTQSRSKLVRSLLASIVERDGVLRLVHASEVVSEFPPRAVAWAALEEQEQLSSLAVRFPNLRFSTFSFFHVRGPIRDLPSRTLSYLDLLRLLFGSPFLFVVFGQPFEIPAIRARAPRSVARECRVDFYRNLKLIRGTPFQSLSAQERAVLGGADVGADLQIIADRQNVPVAKVRAAASKEFRTIAAQPRRWVYGVSAIVLHFLLRRLFGRIMVQGLESLSAVVRQQPVVLVPMHRSHLDYVLVGHALYKANLNPPLVAAGINLFFFPVGSLIKSLGAYFVRRESRNNRVHAYVLKRYVTYLVKRGHLQEFFIEGGRSRSGKMRAPRLGLLSVLVEAYRRRLRKDILFVPVSISYERVIEDSSYGVENTGRKKEKESFGSLLKARSIFRQRYGDAFIRFGAPISLSEYIQSSSPAREARQIVSPLAHDLTRAIRNQVPLTVTGVVYSLLLTGARYGVERSTLSRGIHHMCRMAKALHRESIEFSPSLQRFLEGDEAILDRFFSHGVMQRRPFMGGEVWLVPGKQRFTADFYRNSCLHYFFASSLLALAELCDGRATVAGAMQFYPIFHHDMLLEDETKYSQLLRDALLRLEQEEIIDSAGRFRERSCGFFTPELLFNWLESYLWVLMHLQVQMGNTQSLPLSQFLQQLGDEFRAAVYLGAMTRTEAAAQSTLQSVIDSLVADRCVQLEGTGSSAEVRVVAFPTGRLELLRVVHQRLRQHLELDRLSAAIEETGPFRGVSRDSAAHSAL